MQQTPLVMTSAAMAATKAVAAAMLAGWMGATGAKGEMQCFLPARLNAPSVGAVDGQTVDGLRVQELVGEQDEEWLTYVEASVVKEGEDAGKFRATIEFDVPSDVTSVANQVVTRVNFRGESGTRQEWTLRAPSGLTVWSNDGTNAWVWTLLERETFAGSFETSFVRNGAVELDIVSDTAILENGLFDFVELCLDSVDQTSPVPPSPVPPVPPSPSPAPTPMQACGTVSAIKRKRGKMETNGGLAALAEATLSGQSENLGEMLRFLPAGKGGKYLLMAKFAEVPSGTATMTLTWNVRTKTEGWELEVKNFATGKWKTVVSSVDVDPGYEWRELEASMELASTADYVKKNKIKFRLRAAAGAEDLDMDSFSVCLQGEPSGEPSGGDGECAARGNEVFPVWAYDALVCGVFLSHESSIEFARELFQTHKDNGCTVIKLDSTLSTVYLDEPTFDARLAKVEQFTAEAKKLGLHVVIYNTLLEVLTQDGENRPDSAAKAHPEWLQYLLNGAPNVFYGTKEHWVEEGDESAWMSPASAEYTSFVAARVAKVAATSADGYWGDVPIFSDTAGPWAGASPASAAAFRAWTKDQGFCGGNGCELPDAPSGFSSETPRFRYWLMWRHEILASFLETMRAAGREVKPNFLFFVENYSTDYMDATVSGLDATWFKPSREQGLTTTWEIDSVSNAEGMKYASHEDFANQITMRKFARGVDGTSPSWAFAYGHKALDASFVMAGALAVGTNPLETKTPSLDVTVSASFRSAWFSWAQEHSCALFRTPRLAKVGVLYSSSSRDHVDILKCGYGMYNQVTSPTDDPEWWASGNYDSATVCEHLAAYRGASYVLQRLHVPFAVVPEIGLTAGDLEGLSLLWLPSTAAITDDAKDVITAWVRAGGTVLATGATVPGRLDGNGAARNNAMRSVFGDVQSGGTRTNRAGDGVALYRGDLDPAQTFASAGAAEQSRNMAELEPLIRLHAPSSVMLEFGEHVYLDQSIVSGNKQFLYLANYIGMQQPAVEAPRTLVVHVRAPQDFRVRSAVATSPNSASVATIGELTVTANDFGWASFAVTVDKLSIIKLEFEAAPWAAHPPAGTAAWRSEEMRQVAQEGLSFILNKMRDASKPEPYRYGVFTEFKDTDVREQIYADGHHMTAEHMGLTLRAAACLRDREAFEQSEMFVRDAMLSPLFKVINWAVDKDTNNVYLQPAGDFQIAANAPLDDLRAIQGLFEGSAVWDDSGAAALAETAMSGLFWTTRTKNVAGYPDGVLGMAFDFQEVEDLSLNPPAVPRGIGEVYDGLVSVNYHDLQTLFWGSQRNPALKPLLESAVRLMLDAEIDSSGLFYNGRKLGGKWTGDFENQGYDQGKHLKVIQELWICIHLARAAQFPSGTLPSALMEEADAAAGRCYGFFKSFYQNNGKRIPEYLQMDGSDVPLCPGSNKCLSSGENLINGEARIYALFARAGLIRGDSYAFLHQVLADSIVPDRKTSGERSGMIGVSTAANGDAEAWNTLEAVLSICMIETN